MGGSCFMCDNSCASRQEAKVNEPDHEEQLESVDERVGSKLEVAITTLIGVAIFVLFFVAIYSI